MISTRGVRLVHLALASFEKGENQANFLRRYSLDRLPNEPEFRQRAAEFLRKLGKEDLAREVELRGQSVRLTIFKDL